MKASSVSRSILDGSTLKGGFLWHQLYGGAFRLAVRHLYCSAVQTPMACPVPCCSQE